MSPIRRLVVRLRAAMFDDSLLGFFMNPYHITRRRLYVAIHKLSTGCSGSLLDLGCGSKPYAHLFTGVSNYVGCDLEVSGHDHRRSHVDVFYDGRSIPFPDESFENVVSFETFEHIFNLDEVLQEIHRVLKKNGKLLVSLPFCWEEHEVPYDFARYSSFGIKHLLSRHGFEVVEHRKTGTYLLTLTQLVQNYIFNHLLPRKGRINHLIAPLLFLPMNLLALLLNSLLPSGSNLYLNNVILAKRVN